MSVSEAASWTCSCTPGVRALLREFLSSLEANGEALALVQEGSHGCPLTLLLHKRAIKRLTPVPGVVTQLAPSWGALGQEQSSSAVEASLHTSCGSTQSEPGVGPAGRWGLALGRAILRLNQINNEC